MPDYGLKVINANGKIQIDSTYRNIALVDSGDSASVSNNDTDAEYVTQINFASPIATIPLVLIRPSTSYPVTIDCITKSGSNYTGFGITTQISQSVSIDWRCYTAHPAPSAEPYGLKIRNPSNELVFDSGKNYFKIYSITDISLPTASSTQDITHSGVENPFYLITMGGFVIALIIPGPPTWLYYALRIGMKKLSSTSVRLSWYPVKSYYAGAGGTGAWIPSAKLIVCIP